MFPGDLAGLLGLHLDNCAKIHTVLFAMGFVLIDVAPGDRAILQATNANAKPAQVRIEFNEVIFACFELQRSRAVFGNGPTYHPLGKFWGRSGPAISGPISPIVAKSTYGLSGKTLSCKGF